MDISSSNEDSSSIDVINIKEIYGGDQISTPTPAIDSPPSTQSPTLRNIKYYNIYYILFLYCNSNIETIYNNTNTQFISTNN